MTIAEQLLAEGEATGRTKGRAEGEVKGRVASTQDKILDLLRLRFDVTDDALAAAVRAIGDQARLDALFVAAVRAEDVDAFRRALP